MQPIHAISFDQLFRLFVATGYLLSMVVAVALAPSETRLRHGVWLLDLVGARHPRHNAMSAAIPNGGPDTLAVFWMVGGHRALGVWARSAAHMDEGGAKCAEGLGQPSVKSH